MAKSSREWNSLFPSDFENKGTIFILGIVPHGEEEHSYTPLLDCRTTSTLPHLHFSLALTVLDFWLLE